MSLIEALTEARRRGDPAGVISAIPYARFLGIDLEMRDGSPIAVMGYGDNLLGNPVLPALHGGPVGALMEIAGLIGLVWRTRCTVFPKTIDIAIDYLRAGRPEDTRAEASITRQGRRIANVRVEAWQRTRAKPIAAAHIHFMLDQAENLSGAMT